MVSSFKIWFPRRLKELTKVLDAKSYVQSGVSEEVYFPHKCPVISGIRKWSSFLGPEFNMRIKGR